MTPTEALGLSTYSFQQAFMTHGIDSRHPMSHVYSVHMQAQAPISHVVTHTFI